MASQILSLGHYVPTRCVSNAELETLLQLESGWIVRRSGIQTRYWAAEHESLADMAEKAARMALQNACMAGSDIALTLLATSTPDHLLPPTAPLLTSRLGLSQSGAFDLAGACSGFLYALTLADSFVRTHAKPVLVIAANILSRKINLSDPNSAILFGDAAAALILAPSLAATQGILAANFASDGSAYDYIAIAAGGSQRPFSPDIALSDAKINLKNGKAIFHHAVEMMVRCTRQVLLQTSLSVNDLDHVIPHQGNQRISKSIAKQLCIPNEKIISIIQQYGNSSAAGIPLALSIRHQADPFEAGEKLLLTAAGAGMTGGAVVIGI